MTRFVWELPAHVQREILSALVEAGIEPHDIERAMNSRLCDLEDTIDIREWKGVR